MKDPLDNGRTQEIQFPSLMEGMAAPAKAEEPTFETTVTSDVIEAVRKALRARSFSQRNPHLGKMINCQICGRRHRESDTFVKESVTHEDGVTITEKTLVYLPKCEQKFTNVVNGYEYFREGKDGELVPYFRTCIDPELQPTPRQIAGSPLRRNFGMPRYNPHPNRFKLMLIERTRAVFTDMGFKETKGEQAQKNMAIARKEAGHQLHRESRESARKKRNQQKKSRKINQGR